MALGRVPIEPSRPESAELVVRKHELAYLASLREAGREVVEIERERGLGGLEEAAARTRAAMRSGAEVIYQAALFDGNRRRGDADFLQCVDVPSGLGDWSYEVADTKLARRLKPY